MNEISKEYATALFTLAREEKELEAVAQGMNDVREVLSSHPEFVDLIASPALSGEERNQTIDTVFHALPEHVVSIIKLLCDHGHARGISDCCEAFDSMVQFAQSQATAIITSAVPLNEKEKEALVGQLERRTGKKVLPEYSIDSTLLGGVTVEMDGYVYDGSLRHRLKEVKEVIEK